MNIETIIQYAAGFLVLAGVLAFLTSLIVQVIRELPVLKAIPAGVATLVTAGVLCVVSALLLCIYFHTAVTWYYIVAALIASFIVYLIATGGWKKLRAIWDKTKYKKSGEGKK